MDGVETDCQQYSKGREAPLTKSEQTSSTYQQW